ncbi:Predicted cobalt transporter CbtA [Rhodococcus wratislaviensis]|uniref:Predicted cobalt transporter CbtA n=1 Tax=Rhodococcus wratislaviensis TaxID=44752 RepID=A0A402C660_RHOWR|nr:Predicted cobalt transporter CbtA [Rhodococcus wratislaviensis]
MKTRTVAPLCTSPPGDGVRHSVHRPLATTGTRHPRPSGSWRRTPPNTATTPPKPRNRSPIPPAPSSTPGFPADDLYQFRLYSVAAQLILWSTIGLAFAPLADRRVGRRTDTDRTHQSSVRQTP